MRGLIWQYIALSLIALITVSCGPGLDTETHPDFEKTQFEKITREEIATLNAQGMLNSGIIANQTDIPVGQIIVYKTRNGIFGKMQVTGYSGNAGFETLLAVSVNFKADGSEYSPVAFEVPSTWVRDLESGQTIGGSGDFHWSNQPPLRLQSLASALFRLY